MSVVCVSPWSVSIRLLTCSLNGFIINKTSFIADFFGKNFDNIW